MPADGDMEKERNRRVYDELRTITGHEHNCIPARRWFRRGWVCVRCDRWFREQP